MSRGRGESTGSADSVRDVVQSFSYQPIAERKCESGPTGRMWLSGFLAVPASDLRRGAPTPGDVSWHRQSWLTLGSARLTVALRHSGIRPLSFRSTQNKGPLSFEILVVSLRQPLLYSSPGFGVWDHHWPRREIGEAEKPFLGDTASVWPVAFGPA